MIDVIRWNLGSCDRHFPGYVAIDICKPADILADLGGPWPGEESTITEIRAWDIIEHISDCDHVSRWACERCWDERLESLVRRLGREMGQPAPLSVFKRPFEANIHVMNEAWRVLKPGGLFDIEVPTTDGRGAWQDPQHKSFWNLNSFKYSTDRDPHLTRFKNGTLARFKVLSHSMTKHPDEVWKLKIILEAVK